MFDTILDEFEDVSAASAEAVSGGFRKLPVDDSEDDNEVDVHVVSQQAAEGDIQLESPDELIAADESESWSDDPVRMYLTQMGEIPLLTRAKKSPWPSESKRRVCVSVRQGAGECDYVLVEAYKTLKKVYRGSCRSTARSRSRSPTAGKEQIIGRMPHNLKRSQTLIAATPRLEVALSKSASKAAAPRLGGPSAAAAAAPSGSSRSSACAPSGSSRMMKKLRFSAGGSTIEREIAQRNAPSTVAKSEDARCCTNAARS